MEAPRYRRSPAEARRQALIAAAARVLARRGAGGISVRTIAAEAGVSPGLVSHHFDGIEALLAATYRDVAARVAIALDQAAREGTTPCARLLAYVGASFAPPVMDGALLAAWLGLLSLTKTMPGLAVAHGESYAAYRGAVERLLAACDAPGDIRLAAVALTALIDGLWLELCMEEGVFTAAEARGIAERWVAALLGQDSTSLRSC